jgi:hypothetical protein
MMPTYNPFEGDSALPHTTAKDVWVGPYVPPEGRRSRESFHPSDAQPALPPLAKLRDALAEGIAHRIDLARKAVMNAEDVIGEIVHSDVLENGRLVAARKIHADLERLTGELERLMTGRVEP